MSRELPPPKGRGPLFWIIIVFGFLGVGSCLCCSGVFLLLPDARWQAHESRDGGFKVELPAAPRNNLSVRGVKHDPSLKIEGTRLLRRGEEYAIIYHDIPPTSKRGGDDEATLVEGVKELEKAPELKEVIRNVPVIVAGFPAREIEFLGKDGGTYVSRLVIADSRMYLLIAGGPNTRPGNLNVRRFLDSFEITDPKLVAVAKRRAEKAKKDNDVAAAAREQLQRGLERARVKEIGLAAAEAAFEPVGAELTGSGRSRLREAGVLVGGITAQMVADAIAAMNQP